MFISDLSHVAIPIAPSNILANFVGISTVYQRSCRVLTVSSDNRMELCSEWRAGSARKIGRPLRCSQLIRT